MKKLLLILLIAFGMGAMAQAQSFTKLYKDYKEYCNELVADTITQYGNVEREFIPVYNTNGVICKYVYGEWNDTVWDEPKCGEYKMKDGYLYISSSGNILNFDGDYDSWGYPIRHQISCDNSKEVIRKHVCFVKREKITPEGFFEWYEKI